MTARTSVTLQPADDGAALRRAYSCFPSGVVGVCAEIDGTPVGMAASSFATVSLEPALVSLCVQHTSSTWPKLRSAPTLGLSVFAADQVALCKQLAGPSEHRFDGFEPRVADSGSVFVPDAAAVLDCTVYNEVPAGDHVLVLLRIDALDADPSVEPLVFHASTFRALETRA
ncbi:flavin reductase family protein [Williamsia deligens]|uniref:Flavin reductase family protein n=1 Tax=Williamsia deligens TaxID=321325 RepID=A0ABW3GC72_9NOCA|nr:flavin reductase family protein [Williamsia deligens]MCP2192839.1 NADH-FMN oxidoreductase RutF, flavin reductase (DIM6/NTAB) family [Williamsia deligens]